MLLHNIKSDHLRETSRRAVNAERKRNGFSTFHHKALGIPAEVLHLSNDELEAVHGFTKEDIPGGVKGGLTARQAEDLIAKGKHFDSGTTKTAKAVKVKTEKTAAAATSAFQTAFEAGRKGRQQRAGRWASGLVKHHDFPEEIAVEAAVKAANSRKPSWKAAMKAATALAGS